MFINCTFIYGLCCCLWVWVIVKAGRAFCMLGTQSFRAATAAFLFSLTPDVSMFTFHTYSDLVGGIRENPDQLNLNLCGWA